MQFIGNSIWFLFGGIVIAAEYFIAGIFLCATIVGIPFGIQSFKLAYLALWPFGATVKPRKASNGCLFAIMNIIWLIIGGFWIFVTHIALGILFFITIVGIPFGKQHFKLSILALSPFGRGVAY